MINGQNFFDQPVRNDLITYDIWKIVTGQGDDYTTGCLLDYNYFKNLYKMIGLDLSKQQAFDADPKAIQQINFTENLDQEEGATIFFIIEKAKKTILDFSQGTVKVLWMSSYDLPRVAKVSDRKVFACSTISFCFCIISV